MCVSPPISPLELDHLALAFGVRDSGSGGGLADVISSVDTRDYQSPMRKRWLDADHAEAKEWGRGEIRDPCAYRMSVKSLGARVQMTSEADMISDFTCFSH